MKKKKVVVVIGNICAGKTVCVNALVDRLGGRCVVCSVDDMRVEMSVGSFAEDVAVWDKTLAMVANAAADAITLIECSGTGVQYRRVMKVLKGDESLAVSVIKVDVKLQVARDRFFSREKKGVWLEKYNINDSMLRIASLLMAIKADVVVNGNVDKETMVRRFLGVFGI